MITSGTIPNITLTINGVHYDYAIFWRGKIRGFNMPGPEDVIRIRGVWGMMIVVLSLIVGLSFT